MQATTQDGRVVEVEEVSDAELATLKEQIRGYGWSPEWKLDGLFHTIAETDNAPPISFLIAGFLQREGVTAIAGPVRERKSLIALNVAHALLTREKLFDHFEVVKKPERVIYLCPEVALGPFADRLKRIGLRRYVGSQLLYRTLSADGHLDLTDEVFQMAVPGSVVILDTAIRFFDGDENSSKDVQKFANTLFFLVKLGAEAVVMLHHSPKSGGDSMSLENALRGSGDFGGLLTACWGTRLQDPANPYKSTSYLENLKQRDFESKPFEATCGEDCRMHIVKQDIHAVTAPTLRPRRAFAGNKDGMDPAAIDFLKGHPKLSAREAVDRLRELGIKRGKTWVNDQRYELRKERGEVGECPPQG